MEIATLQLTRKTMKKLIILIATLQLAACATETEHKPTPVPGEKPVAVARPTGLKVAGVQKKPTQPPESAAGVGGIAWDANPATDEVVEYHIYRLQGNSPPKLEGATQTTSFRPDKKGTFNVTAVNGGGESLPSAEIKL
jgi:hypothetical protein